MKFKKLAAILMLVIFITSCAAFMPVGLKTPKDRSVFFMSYYMAQLKDYNARYQVALEMFQADQPVSQLEQDIISAKYTFLMEAWYPIAAYDGYVSLGEVPPAELEEQINKMIAGLEAVLKGVANE